MRLFLVRHGETAWNQERRVQGGGSDVPLNQRGRQQAARAAEALAAEKLDAIYASPCTRAVETAQAVAIPHRLEVEVMEELREIDAGEADGLSFEELPQRFPEFWQQWRGGTGSLRWPSGESLEELRERVGRGLQHIQGPHPQGTVAVVAHTFALSAIILYALALPPDLFRRLRLDNGSISLLHLDQGSPRLLYLNDTCHNQGV